MKTTVKVVTVRKGIESVVVTEIESKASARILVKNFNEERAYFIDEDNKLYAYI